VRDVKDADVAADRDVLGADALVLHWHLVSRKRHHPRPGGEVTIV
jgi:hypothetical protein